MAKMVAIDEACDLDLYFAHLREYYISNWQLWYAHIIHYFFSIMCYFFYFVYGIVWSNEYDQGLAIGIII